MLIIGMCFCLGTIKAEAAAEGGTYTLLISGINRNSNSATYKDCIAIRKAWKQNQYKRMNKSWHSLLCRYNAENTSNNINSAWMNAKIKKEFKKSTANDTIIFYYSGHGTPNKGLLLRAGTSKQKSRTYSYKTLAKQLSKYKARRIIVILDACFAGAFYEQGLKKLSAYQQKRFIVYLSSNKYEQSYMGTEMSRFTAHMVDGLTLGNGGIRYADFNRSGSISNKELGDYVSIQLKTDLLHNNYPRWRFHYLYNYFVYNDTGTENMNSVFIASNPKAIIFDY